MKTDFNLLENLNVGVSLFLTDSKRKSYVTDTEAFTNPSNYTRMVNPYLEVKDENGDYIYDPDILDNDGRNLEFNFIEEMKNTSYSLKNRSIKPMITLDYKVTCW